MLVYRRADTPLLLKEVTHNDEVDVEIINVELSVGGRWLEMLVWYYVL